MVTSRPGYMAEFLEFWSARPEVRKIWYSLLTPQRGEDLPDCLTMAERDQVLIGARSEPPGVLLRRPVRVSLTSSR